MKRIIIFQVLGILLTTFCWAQSGNRPIITQSFTNGYFIDQRLNGTWVKENNQHQQIIFYANIYIVYENNVRVGSGVFIMNNTIINLMDSDWDLDNQGEIKEMFYQMELNYVLQPNILIISEYSNYFDGRWNKINTNIPVFEVNPVVGLWREVANNGTYLYYFFPDNTGIYFLFNSESGLLIRSDEFIYNPNTRTFNFNFTSHGARYILEGGRLYFLNHTGQRIGSLEKI